MSGVKTGADQSLRCHRRTTPHTQPAVRRLRRMSTRLIRAHHTLKYCCFCSAILGARALRWLSAQASHTSNLPVMTNTGKCKCIPRQLAEPLQQHVAKDLEVAAPRSLHALPRGHDESSARMARARCASTLVKAKVPSWHLRGSSLYCALRRLDTLWRCDRKLVFDGNAVVDQRDGAVVLQSCAASRAAMQRPAHRSICSVP